MIYRQILLIDAHVIGFKIDREKNIPFGVPPLSHFVRTCNFESIWYRGSENYVAPTFHTLIITGTTNGSFKFDASQ